MKRKSAVTAYNDIFIFYSFMIMKGVTEKTNHLSGWGGKERVTHEEDVGFGLTWSTSRGI